MHHPCRYLYLLLTLARGVFWGPRGAPGVKLNTGARSASNWALSVLLCLTIALWWLPWLTYATDSATSTVCASHCQTTKWLAYGCHTSVLLFDWCIPFLVLFQLCDVPQTLNIQHSHPSSGFLHGRRLMNKDVAALAGVLDFALLCLCCRSFSLSALLS